jgi:hypothetical protein
MATYRCSLKKASMKKLQRRWLNTARLAVAAMALVVLSFGAADAQTASGTRFEGTLSVVWGDPRPGLSGGGTQFSLMGCLSGNKSGSEFHAVLV